jgi:hypothetical protein
LSIGPVAGEQLGRALIQEQLATLDRERDQAPTPCKATEKVARPRLTQPQHTVEIFWSMPDQYSQRISPVLALGREIIALRQSVAARLQ